MNEPQDTTVSVLRSEQGCATANVSNLFTDLDTVASLDDPGRGAF